MIHAALKQSTRDAHLALESKLRILVSDELSLDQYVAIQKRFYGFYRLIEARLLPIRGWDDPKFELAARLKLPLLINDLTALAVGSEELAGLPLCESLPRLETVPEALGCLYVLEGSTLGGKVIARHLKQVLSLDSRYGCSFFNSYGDNVGWMWSTYLEVLTRHCQRHGDADIVIHSACQTFASLDRWFFGDPCSARSGKDAGVNLDGSLPAGLQPTAGRP